MSPLTHLTLTLLLHACLADWQNDWDKQHTAQCDGGEYVTRVRSVHHDFYEDRRWEVTCGREAGLRADKDCAWTDYVNDYDEVLSFTCPGNKVLTGMSSDHDNHKEDRRYKFLCCQVYAERKVCADGTFGADCQFACQCGWGEVCDKVNGSCPGTCLGGKYGPGCQLDSNCYYGHNHRYLGDKATTASGETCQRWEDDSPHRHSYHETCRFTDGVLPENYCRTTLTDLDYDPWCYTTNPDKRWETCGVQSCECPEGRFGEDCALECHCSANRSCDRVTGECPLGDCAVGWGGEGCQVRIAPAPTGCYVTDYANDWDGEMDWRAPSRSVVTGAFSHHSDYKEDRRWKFFVCQI